VGDHLFAGASDLEGRVIREVMALAMDAPAAAKSGHSGTAMALAPLGVTLFSRVLRHDPADPAWPDRDRFILSAGHASILQYALAHEFGYEVAESDLRQFRQAHSITPGHPEAHLTPTVEVTTGPLGQGLANAVGMAIAERILRADYGADLVDHRLWVIAGDGCIEEGISHEAASLAGSLGLAHLVVVYDDNYITIDGPTELALHDDTPLRFAAYGWNVVNLGEAANDLVVLEGALRGAVAESARPTLIVLRSHIGYPSPVMMDRREAHGNPFSAAAITEAKALLGVPDEAFALDPDLPGAVVASLTRQREGRAAWQTRLTAAGERGTALLEQLRTNGALRDSETPERFAGGAVATRTALQRAMDVLAPATPGLTAGSADLTDNTGVVLAHSSAQGRDNPGGRQIHFGVREFAMGATLVGQALHGGIRPMGSTFFVFSDYMRPAIRLAALSEAPAIFVFTHDSVGVGQDGPTHQPVEHLMALRAMPRLHVVRPSDANETLDLVERLLHDPRPAPTALVLTRQDVAVFEGDDARASAQGAWRGGYVVRDAVDAVFTLVATGSEVQHCLTAQSTLLGRGVAARVVALPCWRCFDAQEAAYRDAVLRRDLPSVSLEAGATLGWGRYVDAALGIDSFGMSAPGPVVFEHFHVGPTALVDHVERTLEASS